MPGRDGTGPLGQGPMTGWGAGFCGQQRGISPAFGYGRGRGMGRGFRRGSWYWDSPQYLAPNPRRFGMGPASMNVNDTQREPVFASQRAVLEEKLAYYSSVLEEIQKQLDNLGATE